MKITKKILSIIFALFLCVQNVSAQIYYEDTKERLITKGVWHTYTERLSDEGWQKINMLRADLKDENVEVITLSDKRGISYKNTLTALTKESDAVASINADFFDTTTPSGRTTPLGLTIKDEALLSSPSHDDGLATFFEGDESFGIDYFSAKIYLVAENGNKAQIIHVNKYHSTQSMVLFTREFGERTPENNDGSIEMVVENGIVSEIVTREEGSIIPENGYVIKVNPAVNNFFRENFKEGDKAEIEFSLTPDTDKIKNAVGGGTVLVKEGKRAEFTHNIQGSNPRSAAGISKDNKTLFLVTVEGRETSTPGMTQKELADFMISIGAYSAINFDGGGSAEMVTRNPENGNMEVTNTPSAGSERAISTGVGIKSVGKKPYFKTLSLSASKEYTVIGDYVEIWGMPYDNYQNPINVGDNFKFRADDNGRFEGNRYYPVKSGVRKVYAELDGVKAQIEIKVLGEVASLSFYPMYIPDGGGYVSVVASDSEGFKSQISPDKIGWRVEKGSGSVENGNIKAEKGSVISATFGDKIIKLTVGQEGRYGTLDKFRQKIEKADFVILPSMLPEDTLLNKVINERIKIIAKREGEAFSVSDTEGAASLLKMEKSEKANCIILTVRNDKAVTEDIEKWQEFLALSEEKEKNICIYLAGGAEFSDESLKSMFDKSVKKLYNQGKNVFVICPGEKNDVYIDSGVRYITFKKLPEITLDNFDETFSDAVYLKFKSNGEKLFYCEEKLFGGR